MATETRLSERLEFLDGLSQELAAKPTLSLKEGEALARTHGLPADPAVLARAHQRLVGTPASTWTLGWDRPTACSMREAGLAQKKQEIARLERRSLRWLGGSLLGVIFGVGVVFLSLNYATNPNHWPLMLLFFSGWGVVLGGYFGTRNAESLDEERKSQAVQLNRWSPATPTREQVNRWAQHPALHAYLQACLASEVGLLNGDVAVLEEALAQMARVDQVPLSSAEIATVLGTPPSASAVPPMASAEPCA